jgi:hypothetical protein
VLAAYGTVVLLVVLSLATGQAVCAAARADRRAWLAPVSGLAVLILVALVFVRFPGAGTTALIAVAAVSAGCAAKLRGRLALWQALRDGGPAAAATLAGASLPFLAAGRFGVPGVSVSNDPAFHLHWIELLRTGADRQGVVQEGYPLGPHALVAAAGELTGDVHGAFVGLLLAVPVLTALTALGALDHLSPPRRSVAAALAGLAYVAAANLAQAAYKEPIVALFLVATAVTLREAGVGRLAAPASAALVALWATASMAVFSWPGAAWPLGASGCFLAATYLRGGDLLRTLRRASRGRVAGALAAGVAAVMALAALAAGPLDLLGPEVVELGGGGLAGNVPAPVSFYEVTGVWPAADFRTSPGSILSDRLLGAASLAAAALAGWWWARRRDLAVPASVVAGLGIYAFARAYSSYYVAFKAMSIVGPVTMMMVAGALLGAASPLRRLAGGEASPAGWAWTALAAAFVGAAAWSSGLALRGALVREDAHANELATFRAQVRGQPTLFLGKDDYARWELRGARLGTPLPYGLGGSVVPLALRRADPVPEGDPLDFDTVAPRFLDRYRFVVAPRTAYASIPPPNWRRVAVRDAYALWERTGRTRQRQVLSRERGTPGAVLNCSAGPGRALSSRRGRALVRPAPVLGDPGAWRLPSGGRRPANVPDTIEPGQSVNQALRLGRGRWELSIQYLGPVALRVRAGELRSTLPPNQELPGPWWRAGTLVSRGGPVTVAISAEPESALATRHTVAIGNVAAVRLDVAPRWIPLSRACGRYVDGYVLEPAR